MSWFTKLFAPAERTVSSIIAKFESTLNELEEHRQQKLQEVQETAESIREMEQNMIAAADEAHRAEAVSANLRTLLAK